MIREDGFVIHETHMLTPPQTHPSSHCATLAELPDGRLMVAWYAGSREKARDVVIWASRYDAGSWERPFILTDTTGRSDGNPLLFVDRGGRLWLLWVVIEGEEWQDAQLYVKHSLDGGQTWGQAHPFAPQSAKGWMVRNKPIWLRDGTLLLPLYDEVSWRSFCLRSTDDGKRWEKGQEIDSKPGNIQMTVAQRPDGTLFAMMRSGTPRFAPWQKACIWQATSADSGRCWSAAEPSALPNPDSGIDMVALQDGSLLLAFNNTARGRTPLSLARSTDWGRSWQVLGNVEDAPGEFSYPALIQSRDGRVHLMYTFRRQGIRHRVL